TITTEDEVDISRGDMIVHTANIPRVSNSLKTMLVWMDEKVMDVAKTYDIKIATTTVSGTFEHINYKVDVNTYKRTQVKSLELNDIASCKMLLTTPIAVDNYNTNRQTGSFIVVDRITSNTVGAGMIVDVSKRDSDKVEDTNIEYTQAEKELNKYIINNFPEWECKVI
ncbi:MAG: sulfate adenylyltransferase subunit CysN, partial [Campylobacterota bacterium]|nr:sulfate adenylyltransferase subunit CysN [Campylobacterota bacterium]